MKKGHEFKSEHGFTGSAGKDHRPKMHGFEHAEHPHKVPMISPQIGSDDGEISAPSMGGDTTAMKRGGKVSRHDTHPKHDQVKYDNHGFQHHKNHK